MTILKKIYRKINAAFSEPHNMRTHPAEQYYFKQYWKNIAPELKAKEKILEIGSHEGRFTIPLIENGHEIDATDIYDRYGEVIRSLTSLPFNYFTETIHDSIKNRPLNTYDTIVCIELLYTLKDFKELLSVFYSSMKSDSKIITSHRTKGYYLYRYLKEKSTEQAHQVLQNSHPQFNAQSKDELLELYSSLGFNNIKIYPIGILSGFGKDAFSSIMDPGKLNEEELASLQLLEENKLIHEELINNARYLLVIAHKV